MTNTRDFPFGWEFCGSPQYLGGESVDMPLSHEKYNMPPCVSAFCQPSATMQLVKMGLLTLSRVGVLAFGLSPWRRNQLGCYRLKLQRFMEPLQNLPGKTWSRKCKISEVGK